MIRRSVLALCSAVLGAQPALPAAADCPAGDPRLLFHSCAGPARAELLLLPEEADALDAPADGRTLAVTGAYTGADARPEGRPNPVGLFVDNGRVVSPNLARMDGILLIDRQGRPRLYRSTAVPLGDATFDLTDPEQRLDFAERAAERGASVMQSHLLISGGALDVRPRTDAPFARRRLLFTGPQGWGVYQTAESETLYDAARALHEHYAPEMAINLDMGSFDYCVARENGAATTCGVLGAAQTEKLSNLLRLSHPAR